MHFPGRLWLRWAPRLAIAARISPSFWSSKLFWCSLYSISNAVSPSRMIQEDGGPDEPQEGEGLEALREGIVLHALEGDGGRRDDRGRHRRRQDDPLGDQLVLRRREPIRSEQEIHGREEPDEGDRAEGLGGLERRGRDEPQADRGDDRGGDGKVQHAGLGLAGLGLVRLNPLQVRR